MRKMFPPAALDGAPQGGGDAVPGREKRVGQGFAYAFHFRGIAFDEYQRNGAQGSAFAQQRPHGFAVRGLAHQVDQEHGGRIGAEVGEAFCAQGRVVAGLEALRPQASRVLRGFGRVAVNHQNPGGHNYARTLLLAGSSRERI